MNTGMLWFDNDPKVDIPNPPPSPTTSRSHPLVVNLTPHPRPAHRRPWPNCACSAAGRRGAQ